MPSKWEVEYNEDTDKTTIRWVGDGVAEEKTVDGEITEWRNGYPNTVDAREAVADLVQSAGTPQRIRMQFDVNYGFSDVSDGRSDDQ